MASKMYPVICNPQIRDAIKVIVACAAAVFPAKIYIGETAKIHVGLLPYTRAKPRRHKYEYRNKDSQ